MSVSFDYYRIFYFVGKYGSFTAAAKILNNNQPNITRVMNNLEAELGCRLFVRSRKGIALTPEGEKLFAHVESAYRQIQLGEAEILAGENLQGGSLSLAISEIALHSFILPVLQRYKQEHPGVHIQIMNHSTPEGIRAIEQGIAELAVISTPMKLYAPLSKTPIRSIHEIPVTGPYYHERIRGTVDLSALCSFPFITLGRNTASFQYLSEVFTRHDLLLEPSIEVATTDQILPMVMHDIGIGVLPKTLAEQALREERIFAIDLAKPLPERTLCYVKDKSRPLSAAAHALEEMILEASDLN